MTVIFKGKTSWYFFAALFSFHSNLLRKICVFNVTRLKMTLTQRSADHSQSQRLFLWSFLYSEIVPYTVSCIRQLHHFTLHPAYPFSLKRPIWTPRTHYVARFGWVPRLLNIDRPANVADNGTHCCLVFTCSKRSLLKISPYTLKIFAKVYVRTFWYVAFHIFQGLYGGNQRGFYSNRVSSCYFSIS